MEFQFCNSKECVLCRQLRRDTYIKTKAASRDRLRRLLDSYSPPIMAIQTETNDWEYQEYVDNSLSLGRG